MPVPRGGLGRSVRAADWMTVSENRCNLTDLTERPLAAIQLYVGLPRAGRDDRLQRSPGVRADLME